MYNLTQIQTAEFYATRCIESMQEYALKHRSEIDKRWEKSDQAKQNQDGKQIILNKRKDLEMQKVRHINKQAFNQLQKIQTRMPKAQKIPVIYQELLNTSDTSLKEYEQALKTIRDIQDGIDVLCSKYVSKLQYARGHDTLKYQFKKFMGKFNSHYTKNQEAFNTLKIASEFLNKLPTFKDMFTIGIAGFPNVGKSTLMQKITGSKVEIQNYPFTTKGLMFGYFYQGEEPLLQLIDTPGLLGRKKSNAIEQRAQIIIQQFANQLVFVIDVTESCGYELDLQLKLFKDTTKVEKDIVIYFSKTDLFEQDEEEEFERIQKQFKKYKSFTNHEELKTYLLQQEKKTNKISETKIQTIKI